MASSLWPFQSPETHEAVSAIIREHSTNKTDVREAVLANLDLAGAEAVLDLGCGFGFMTEAVARCVAPNAFILGVDMWAGNEQPFLERVGAAGRRGRFLCAQVGSTVPCPDRSYDLVVSSYSLYFFLDALPEVARVLRPGGRFLVVTHCERSFVGLLHAAGLEDQETPLRALSRKFSAENARRQLEEWFGEVTRRDYRNSLRFRPEHEDDLLDYLRFKLPLLVPDAQPGDELPEAIADSAKTTLARRGEIVVEKNDAAFCCRGPRCR